MSYRVINSSEQNREVIERYDTWLLDCDGVLWRGSELIEGASEFLHLLRSRGKKILFVTNNASTSRRNYKKKFEILGVEAHIDEIFGSAYAAAVYLSSVVKFPKEKKVFLIGMEGLEEELRNEGISVIAGTDDAYNTFEPFDPTTYTPEPDVGAVLCGFDSYINFSKYTKAFIHLNTNPDCLFLVTNEDPTYPDKGFVLPAAGSVSAPIRYALGRDPLCLGKPSPSMLECIRAKHDFDPERAIMVGDRLSTDILFGKQGNLSTMLVLTGVNSEKDLQPEAAPVAIPDYVAASIGHLRHVESGTTENGCHEEVNCDKVFGWKEGAHS